MDITQLPEVEVEAMIYRESKVIRQAQNNIQALEGELARRQQNAGKVGVTQGEASEAPKLPLAAETDNKK